MVALPRRPARPDVCVVAAFFRGQRFFLLFRSKAYAYAVICRWTLRGLLSFGEARELYRRIKAC